MEEEKKEEQAEEAQTESAVVADAPAEEEAATAPEASDNTQENAAGNEAAAAAESEPAETDESAAAAAADDAEAADDADEAQTEAGPENPLGPPNPDHKWYVVHCYSGHEHRAKSSLEERVRSLKKNDLISEVIVPEETVVELVKGQRRTSKRRFFPGYILVKMDLTDESWHVIKDTPKITGFVGDRLKPLPVSEAEIQRMTNRISEGIARPKPKVSFVEGESVRVIDGPFVNFNGVVEDVNTDKAKVRVLVSIFGRSTPVELDFVQVEKL